MEREILFRGKRKDNGEWIKGYFAKSGGSFIICDNGLTYGGFEIFEIIPETRGEFTGLTDKNGTRIFEGDIVYIDREDERGVVSWDNDGACFEVVIDNISTTFRDSWYGHDLEVIGNIHDNPELMGGEKNETNPV